MPDEQKTRKAPRSSITGEFVSKEYAERNKRTTTNDTVPVRSRTVPGAVNLPEEEQAEDEVN